MKIISIRKILLGLIMSILLIAIFTVPVLAESFEKQKVNAAFSEGGHLETDFDAIFMAEWWYLNGNARLVASDGEEKNIGLFVTLAHQESPLIISDDGTQRSHLLTFYGIYSDDAKTNFNYIETFIPRTIVNNYISLNTPYVNYSYPDGLKNFNGSASTGYTLNYTSDNNVKFDLFFQPDVDNTIDQATFPLNFTTYERSHGTLKGSIILNGKKYNVTRADGYMDHMIPVGDNPWPMEMHGWNWFEVTTENYQAVAYAVRSMNDSYSNYFFKHLTLLSRESGKVIKEYKDDEIAISETGWINETAFNRKRPSKMVFSTSDLKVTVNAKTVLYFDGSDLSLTGFVDFMAYEPDDAKIRYNGRTEEGSAFDEYLVSDMGVYKDNN
jgi:hypothetical protein